MPMHGRVTPLICPALQQGVGTAEGLALLLPSAQAWFGYDLQGHDVYSRVIYGARYSVIVGIMATLGTSLYVSGVLLQMLPAMTCITRG